MLADSFGSYRPDLMSLVDGHHKELLAESVARDMSWTFDGQLEHPAHHLDCTALRWDIHLRKPPPEGCLLHEGEVGLVFCVAHQHNWPSKSKPMPNVSVDYFVCFALTSLPVCTHLWHGRFVSQAKCFFLQFTHAEGT